MSDRSAILLFDGTCGFCARSVQFVLDHERHRQTLRFAGLQSALALELRRRHPELDAIDSVIWWEPGTTPHDESIFVRSAAVLRVLRYLGGRWSALATPLSLTPRVIRDRLYDWVARHRKRLIRQSPSCLVPSPDQRARFLDWDSLASGSSR